MLSYQLYEKNCATGVETGRQFTVNIAEFNGEMHPELYCDHIVSGAGVDSYIFTNNDSLSAFFGGNIPTFFCEYHQYDSYIADRCIAIGRIVGFSNMVATVIKGTILPSDFAYNVTVTDDNCWVSDNNIMAKKNKPWSNLIIDGYKYMSCGTDIGTPAYNDYGDCIYGGPALPQVVAFAVDSSTLLDGTITEDTRIATISMTYSSWIISGQEVYGLAIKFISGWTTNFTKLSKINRGQPIERLAYSIYMLFGDLNPNPTIMYNGRKAHYVAVKYNGQIRIPSYILARIDGVVKRVWTINPIIIGKLRGKL